MENNTEGKFTVKEIDAVEKSTVEIEEKLLKDHEDKFEPIIEGKDKDDKVIVDEKKVIDDKAPAPELNDADIISYLKNKYNKDIESVDQLFEEKQANEELPEDVSAYFKYKKETGRSIQDYVKLQQNFDEMDSDKLLSQYYAHTEEGLDSEDIKDLMEDKFGYEKGIDDEADIKKIERTKKRELVKAKKFLNEQKDKYNIPLESSGSGLSGKDLEEFDSYKSYVEKSTTAKEAQKKRYDYFINKTDEVFSDEFKGFEFNVGEKQFTFKPGDKDELKSKQSDVNNFVDKFMDKDSGLMNDAQGYHRAMSVAMNIDKFAEFFFNQGMTSTVDNMTKNSKNINMSVRQSPQDLRKEGVSVKAVGDSSSGSGLKIRSIKKV
jgi:hypothetical protein